MFLLSLRSRGGKDRKMKKRSIKIGHELIAVNEETYREYTRWKDILPLLNKVLSNLRA